MATLERTFAVVLTIPDNEAYTALGALRRMGLDVGDVRRADIWTFDVEADLSAELADTLATIETVFNPNKHELAERPGSRPAPGEVWVAAADAVAASSVGGRPIPGVVGVRRSVAWQLFDDRGAIAAPAVLASAIETFLCNPAFQKARR